MDHAAARPRLAPPAVAGPVTEPDAARPQDVGRSRKRKGSPSPATLSLLSDYQDAMRAELRAVLVELQGAVAPTGLLDGEFTAAEVRTRPALKDRAALWDLAIKLGRELGNAIDPTPPIGSEPPAVVGPGRRRRAVDYG